MEKINLAIIVPVYNESENLDSFLNEIKKNINKLETDFKIIFVNDGSDDDTLSSLLTLKQKNRFIKIIDLSRNFGKEYALTAGLDYALSNKSELKFDIFLPIDVDLQDPPELIPKMIEEWKKGNNVVLAKRNERRNESIIKKLSSLLFYKFFNLLSDHKIPENVGDFRLMDRKVVEEVNKIDESVRFMKGIFSWVGFDSVILEYDRPSRYKNHTKFSYFKLLNFAFDGILSFSSKFLRLFSVLGFFLALFSFLFGCFIIVMYLLFNNEIKGYSSLITSIVFLSGINLMGIGILSQYVARVYQEVKKRPLYIIKKIY